MSDRDEWLTVKKITEELDLHEETVRRWIRDGHLPATRLGSNRAGYRVRRSDLERFILEGAEEMGKAAPVAA